MKKSVSLRAAICAALPDLAANPDRLLMFITKGKNIPAAVGGLSWKYDYTLQIVVLDFTAAADDLMLPILQWAETNQPDLFTDEMLREDGFTFDAELTGNESADIEISLKLTERVGVVREAGQIVSVEHIAEPVYVAETGVPLTGIWLKTEQIA